MTQTLLPDLTRPTRWRLYVRLAWGGTTPHEVTAAFPEDALEAIRAKGVSPERVVAAEFKLLESNEWRQVPFRFLQEAIVLVSEVTCP